MAVWNKYRLTDKGKALVTGVLASEDDIHITRIGLSDANLSDADVRALTALPSEKQTFGIVSFDVKDGAITVYATISNYGLEEAYTARAIGAYCDYGGEESLLAVATAQTPDTISAWNGNQVDTINVKFVIQVDDNANMTADIDPSAYVRIKDIYSLIYPVGSVVLTDGSFKPAERFGGDWEKIHGYLMASGTYNRKEIKAMETGGEESHINTLEEMAAHNHTRGTMEIEGSFWNDDSVYNSWYGKLEGAFTKGKYVGRGDMDSGSGHYDSGQILFKASLNWTGHTSTEGNSKPVPMLPKYTAVDAWVRTK